MSQRNGKHKDPLAHAPKAVKELLAEDYPDLAGVTQKRRDAGTQEPNPSDAESIPLPRGATRAPRGTTPPRDPAPGGAPCVSVSLCNTKAQEARFLPAMFDQARREPIPLAARKFAAPGMQRLVALCKVLQRAADQAGEERFCLSCRVAGEFLGLDHMTANRWLNRLQRAGVIDCPPDKVGHLVHGSNRPGKASEYKYLGD